MEKAKRRVKMIGKESMDFNITGQDPWC